MLLSAAVVAVVAVVVRLLLLLLAVGCWLWQLLAVGGRSIAVV